MNMEAMMKLSSDKKTPTSRKVDEGMMKLEFDKDASTIQNSNPFRGEKVHKAEQSSPILKKEKNTEPPPYGIMHKPKANNAQTITSTARCENKTPRKKLENNFQDKQLRKQRSSVNSRHSGKSYIGRLPTYADAWYNLRRSIVHYNGQMVGTIAAMDDSECVLNYDQVFVRDFVPSALAFLMNGEEEIVKNFLTRTLQLQASLKTVDCFTLAQGVMPASFKVLNNSATDRDKLVADFGDTAIGRVAPVDSGFWWIFLLYAYTKATGDSSLSQNSDFQTGMKRILSLCLHDGYETSPTLLCSDACCMIDRRLGIYGHPIEIQSLFNMALRCAHQLLKTDGEGKEYIMLIEKRLPALDYHMSSYFWLDYKRLNDIYRYKTDEYSHTAINKFNVNPASIPYWLFDFMPMTGGYFIGNVSPGQMDFRWFALGNCLAILSSLATEEQSTAIMDLIEQRWEELVGHMPMKVVYPALQDNEWSTVTGRDPKNTKWSYHNGGSWPVLLWALVAASVKTKRLHIARKAVDVAELRLPKDTWPEYYDGKDGSFVGKQSRNLQTWSIAGYLVAKMMLDDPSHLRILAPPEIIIRAAKPILDRATTMPTLQR